MNQAREVYAICRTIEVVIWEYARSCKTIHTTLSLEHVSKRANISRIAFCEDQKF